eukprot:12610-Heterococcus_DN1.PRE.4
MPLLLLVLLYVQTLNHWNLLDETVLTCRCEAAAAERGGAAQLEAGCWCTLECVQCALQEYSSRLAVALKCLVFAAEQLLLLGHKDRHLGPISRHCSYVLKRSSVGSACFHFSHQQAPFKNAERAVTRGSDERCKALGAD